MYGVLRVYTFTLGAPFLKVMYVVLRYYQTKTQTLRVARVCMMPVYLFFARLNILGLYYTTTGFVLRSLHVKTYYIKCEERYILVKRTLKR